MAHNSLPENGHFSRVLRQEAGHGPPQARSDDAMYVLEARELRKSFGEGEASVEALRGVNMGVQGGEMLAIMGRSGSGKSTMLTLLGGVDVPTSGQILLEGTDLASLDDDQRTLIRRRRIGFVFQAFNLLPILTAEENVALPLELDGVPTRQAHDRALKMLSRCAKWTLPWTRWAGAGFR